MHPRRRYKAARQVDIEQAVYRFTPAGTSEVADLVGISRQAAYHRLRVLDEYEVIWSKDVGPTKVWMHPKIMADPDPDRNTSADNLMWSLKNRRLRRGLIGKSLY
jgi:hypothetical protein